MRNIKAIAVFITILALVGCQTNPTRQSSSLPSAPPGFSWVSDNVGSFLKPRGWFERKESNGSTNALFISRENIETEGQFVVGMSVNQINSWSSSQSSKPTQYAKAFAAKMAMDNEVLKQTVVQGNHPDMNIVRIRGNNNGTKIIVHHISIGMDSTDQVYLLSFEAPESEWEEEIKKGEHMLNFSFLGD